MKAVEFTVPPAYEGASLKGFLRGFAGCSARLLTAAKRMPDGLLRNGISATARTPVSAGDTVRLAIPASPCSAEPAFRPLPVVWEDASVLGGGEPAGRAAHP